MLNEQPAEAMAPERRSTLSTRRIPTGKTGLILGLIAVAGMLALFAYVWAGPGGDLIGAEGPRVETNGR